MGRRMSLIPNLGSTRSSSTRVRARRPVAFARIGPISKNKAPTASSDGDESHRWRNRARKPRQHAKPPRAGTGELKELNVNWKQELDKLGPIYNLYAPETAEARAERLGDGGAAAAAPPVEKKKGFWERLRG